MCWRKSSKMPWSHVILEGYCTYSFNSKKYWLGYVCDKLDDIINKKNLKTTKTKNKNYIPKSKRPAWCKKSNKKRVPQYKCLECDCPFFGYCNAEEKDYALFDEAFEKK